VTCCAANDEGRHSSEVSSWQTGGPKRMSMKVKFNVLYTEAQVPLG